MTAGRNREAGVGDGLVSFAVIAAMAVGGALIGLAIAYLVAGGTAIAVFVGFMTLPLAFGLAYSAWRAILVAWVATSVGRAAWRSRGRGEAFRDELVGALGAARERGLDGLPGMWVFLPITGVVGLLGGLLMALSAERNGMIAGALLFLAAVGVGIVMRRLARAGRLLAPE